MPLLFSYGTLQERSVQLRTFGRILRGDKDDLVGFELSSVRIRNPSFVAASGREVHATVNFNGDSGSRVQGTAFEVTDHELTLCDDYERVADYRRLSGRLASGREAWLYAHDAIDTAAQS
jgi:gamma-glutamylcyclotransferase (GGCT)/AIG2-like uncharacterized protein YtfP